MGHHSGTGDACSTEVHAVFPTWGQHDGVAGSGRREDWCWPLLEHWRRLPDLAWGGPRRRLSGSRRRHHQCRAPTKRWVLGEGRNGGWEGDPYTSEWTWKSWCMVHETPNFLCTVQIYDLKSCARSTLKRGPVQHARRPKKAITWKEGVYQLTFFIDFFFVWDYS